MLELVYRPGRVSCETLGNLGITDEGRSTDTREIGKSYKSELFLVFFFFLESQFASTPLLTAVHIHM